MVIRVHVSPDLGVGGAGKAGAVMRTVVRHANGILRRDQRSDRVVVADAGEINEGDDVAQGAAQTAGLVINRNAQRAGPERPFVFGEVPIRLVGNLDAGVACAGGAGERGGNQQGQGGR